MSGRLPGVAWGEHLGVDYSDEWYTPRYILDQLGAFDLDPASPEVRPYPTAARHLTIADDGLVAPWNGRVWLNPPYSTIEPWMRRLAEHGCGTALIYARTETAWYFESVWRAATALLFLRGRVRFFSGERQRTATINAPAPSVLVAYGDEDADWLNTAADALGAFVELDRRPPPG